MWKILFILLLPFTCVAQLGVAISSDGSLPSPAALLDVKSTNKGFLLPRMTQAQRMSITNPENGLMVFDKDLQRLFQYRNGAWQFILDNSYWVKPPNRRWLINVFDSIGIGTAAPVEKLHVANGNFRLLSGDIMLDAGEIFMNSASATFQFSTAGAEKAFLQLASNDFRIGTNAENTNGRVRLMTEGQTRVTIDDGGLALGLNGKLTKPETGDYQLAAYCYGIVTSDGTVESGTGNFQVEKNMTGGVTEYRIRVEGIEAYSPNQTIILITPRISNVASLGYFQSNNGYFAVQLADKDAGAIEGGFNFLIYKK